MTRKKLLAILLMIVFFAVILSSFALIFLEANHNCSGEECPVCLQVYICEHNIRNLSLGFCGLLLCVFIRMWIIGKILTPETRDEQESLITLKVKLSN